MEFKRQSHAVYHCEYHIVLSTKYGRKIFNEGIFAYMEAQLAEIKKYYPEIEFKKVNHDKDHIHMLVSIPPKMSVSSVVRIHQVKHVPKSKAEVSISETSLLGYGRYIWSEGYFASTVGVNEEIVQRHIENQGKEDSGQAKLVFG